MKFAILHRRQRYIFALWLCLIMPMHANALAATESCIFTMGYRTNERLPFIEQEPSNQGFYQDLYQSAAAKIGCQLKIIRAPKLRVLRELALGNIDFYPGLSFSSQRDEFSYFIPNGLSERAIGISRAGSATITSITQLVDNKMLLLIAPGSYEFGGLPDNLDTRRPPDLDVPSALEYLLNSQGDFFIYDQATLGYYLKNQDLQRFKLHVNCCDNPRPMYVGFSKKSRYFQAQANPDYRFDIELSPDNYPMQLHPQSKAFAFAQALSRMDSSGETQAIYRKYFN